MKIIIFVLVFGWITACGQSADQQLLGRFYGRTPCQELAKHFNIPVTQECIKIKWSLSLYGATENAATGNFELEGFKFRKENILKGNWKITRGTPTDPNGIVYELSATGHKVFFLQRLSPDIFVFLDQHRNIRVGDETFSFGLSRSTK
jgi:hypothetical protein